MNIKIYFNELEYTVQRGLTIYDAASAIGESILQLNYANKSYELISCGLELVEVDGELVNASEFYIEDEIKIVSISPKIKEKVETRLKEISFLDDFLCFVWPIKQNLPLELATNLHDYYCISNYESGFNEYYLVEEVNYIGKIMDELANPISQVVLLVEPSLRDIVVGTPLEIALKEIGFKDIIEVNCGRKIKAIEEVDSFSKEIANKIDNKKDNLPILVTDNPELTYMVSKNYPHFMHNISNIKYSFQIEANVYKKSNDKEIFVVYLTTNNVTNANVIHFVNEDIDSVIMLSQMKYLFEESNVSLNGDELEIDDEKVNSFSKRPLLLDLIVPAFYELIFKMLPKNLAFTELASGYELTIPSKIGAFKFVKTSDLNMIKSNSFDQTLVEVTNYLTNGDINVSESIYDDIEVNKVYQNYLKTPGSIDVKNN